LTFDFQKAFTRFPTICGIDEAGRGSWAGPVVAAAVSIDQSQLPLLLEIDPKDSKKLSPKKREALAEKIIANFSFGIGIVNSTIIDQSNILLATFLAMRQAISSLPQKPALLLIDGNQLIPDVTIRQTAITHGDDLVCLISAASILAKVKRDEILRNMDSDYPEYFFAKHKGYGTKLHEETLNKFGPCSIHRQSFKPIKKMLGKKTA
jgi:ribonuclease HII